uniref:AlNc14C55G4209 protein n=1 Tax=Albugo laibachii Nc14 TaxID=890382 RepID=F0WC23_9STRA|nr:AlNc14C55G4209 [Albugo laibachii Nc14]|eukprot:CCA18704.1 AlNc14C55G4209 [Albugo laibachii Nc14]
MRRIHISGDKTRESPSQESAPACPSQVAKGKKFDIVTMEETCVILLQGKPHGMLRSTLTTTDIKHIMASLILQ